MTILLNPTDHPVGTRLIMRYPDDVDPPQYAGKLYETTISEWSPGGRLRTLSSSWSEPMYALVVEVLP